MAVQGYYKQLQSTHPRLEIKKAGRRHTCAGVAIERGNRPGKLKDVWITGRSNRCLKIIKNTEFYVANKILPPFLLADIPNHEAWVPTCMVCAIETYGEYIEGPAKYSYFRPVTPEMRKEMTQELVKVLDDIGAVNA